MSVTYVIAFTVKPDQRERFLSLLNGVLDAMRHEQNFRNATLHRDPADPCCFLLHETWADHQDVLDVQLHRPIARNGTRRCRSSWKRSARSRCGSRSAPTARRSPGEGAPFCAPDDCAPRTRAARLGVQERRHDRPSIS